MEYPAVVTREGKHLLAEFPDCPGCQTFARPGEDIDAMAAEALEGWLATGLADGEAPPRPSRHQFVPKGAELRWIPVSPSVAAALLVRWTRGDEHLSQADLARRVGVSQQAIAKIERVKGNLTLRTLDRVARALGRRVELKLLA